VVEVVAAEVGAVAVLAHHRRPPERLPLALPRHPHLHPHLPQQPQRLLKPPG